MAIFSSREVHTFQTHTQNKISKSEIWISVNVYFRSLIPPTVILDVVKLAFIISNLAWVTIFSLVIVPWQNKGPNVYIPEHHSNDVRNFGKKK